jgi:hypothetical protein
MARKTYDDIKTHCVICTQEIATDRVKRGAITCNKEHAKERKAQLQAMVDRKECRYCRHPSTPEQREAFKRFRKLEQRRPDILYPEVFEQWKIDSGMTAVEAFKEFLKK